jgi:lysylphosphatidylglycerol synthetase-like protein (DUF2156 family)
VTGVFKWRMSVIEQHERNRQYDFLQAAALCLVVGVVLLIVGAIFRSGSFDVPGLSTRNRIELISESANVYTASLILAAVAALSFLPAERAARMRPLVVITLIVGIAIAILAMFSVVDVLTVHIPDSSSSSTFSIGLSQQHASFADRLGGILPALGAVFVALVASVGANRIGGASSGSAFTPDE